MIASQLNLLLQNFKGCLGNPKINGGKHSSHFYQKKKKKPTEVHNRIYDLG